MIHKDENDKDDDIDNNMITPFGLDKPRSQIEVSICIYSADILFLKKITNLQKFTKNFAYFKRSYLFLNDETHLESELKRLSTHEDGDEENVEKNSDEYESDLENIFVRITFAGIQKKTSGISFRKTNNPGWNETLVFNILYPPLIRLFKIELCSESSFGVNVLAWEKVDIDNISDYRTGSYFLPSLGPSYIDLYTEPQNYQKKYDLFKKETPTDLSDQNSDNKRHGSYKARLHLSVKSANTSMLKSASSNSKIEHKRSIRYGDKLIKKFKAFILISEVNMIIDSAYRNDLHFQLCVGKLKLDMKI